MAARALRALSQAERHTTAALAAERRRAPGHETKSAPHLEMRMESADQSVAEPFDIGRDGTERAT